jgi:hypothetical protein
MLNISFLPWGYPQSIFILIFLFNLKISNDLNKKLRIKILVSMIIETQGGVSIENI